MATAEGYGPANVISLLKDLRGHLRGLDLSRLAIRGAYLQGVDMQDATLAGALLRECVLSEVFDAITAVAVSKSGQYWAAISRWGEVRVWREEGKLLHLAWQAHTDLVFALDFSPDERTLASGGHDGSLKLWDIESGALLWSNWLTKGNNRLAFSPDGRLLASGGLDATLRLWDVKQGRLLAGGATSRPGLLPGLEPGWTPAGQWRLHGYDSALADAAKWDGS